MAVGYMKIFFLLATVGRMNSRLSYLFERAFFLMLPTFRFSRKELPNVSTEIGNFVLVILPAFSKLTRHVKTDVIQRQQKNQLHNGIYGHAGIHLFRHQVVGYPVDAFLLPLSRTQIFLCHPKRQACNLHVIIEP